jgi:diguanylate cyclase (GGDEF)-like protein
LLQGKLVSSLLLVITLFVLVLSISFRSILHARETETWVRHTHVVMENLDDLSAELTEAESSQRGFLLTGDKAYRERMNAALQDTQVSLSRIRELVEDNSRQQKKLSDLTAAVSERMSLIRQESEVRETKGEAAAVEALKAGRAKILSGEIRSILADLTTEESGLLSAREAESDLNTEDTLRALTIGSLFGILLLLVAGWLFERQTDSLEKAQEGLRETNKNLTRSMAALTAKTVQARALAEMSDILQSCLTLEEARDVIARFFRDLLPEDSGAVYLHNHARESMEPLLVWGKKPPIEAAFASDDCWALRRGRPHRVNAAESVMLCKHIGQRPEADCQCVPLVAQNEAFGLMYIESGKQAGMEESVQGTVEREEHELLVRRMAETVALACANLRLRESLRYQSIRDSLTGLFNRRYLDETLDREIRRAYRQNRPVSVILLDLDHFKQFNDTLGHGAGDSLLRALGDFLRGQVRQEDIACRYGGEEFALVLPDAALEIARGRAEQIREGIKHLAWQQQIPSAESVTISAGVAVFPTHGASASAILQEADQALYAAKSFGRDRVVLAGAAELSRVGALPTD